MHSSQSKNTFNSTSDNSVSDRNQQIFKFLPLLTLILSLLLTLFLWRVYSNSLHRRAQAIYDDKTAGIVSRIVERLHDHEQVLRGAAGLFKVNEETSRADWRHYVSALQLDENHPGILGVGYTKWLTPAEKDANVRQIRSEGFPEYSIRPPGERPVYTSIIYLEPFDWRNQRAFGYDMYSEPVRRAAMDKARDENAASVAAKIILVQETDKGKQSGMLMYVPVYKQGMALDTVERRREAFTGFAYSPIRMNDFVYGTFKKLPQDIAFDIAIVGGAAADNLMFSSIKAEKLTVPKDYTPIITTSTTVNAYGCSWQFTFKTLPSFSDELNQRQSYIFLFCGLTFSALLTYLVFVMMKSRKLEIRHAQEKIGQLDRRLSLATDSAKIGVWDYDVIENRLIWDDWMYAIYGINKEDFIGAYQAWQNGLHPDDKKRGDDEIGMALRGEKEFDSEFRVVWPTGEVRYIKANAQVIRDADGKPLRMIGVNYDITQRKLAEQDQKESKEILSLILNSTAEAIYGIDLNGCCTFCNQACLDILGYDNMEELLGKNMHDQIHHTLPDGSSFPVQDCRIFKAFLLRQGAHVDDELLWRKDGSSFPSEYWSYPQRRNGEITGAVITFLDITERRQAEDTLRMERERLAGIIEGTDAGTWEWNVQTGEVVFNDRWAEIVGYTLEELSPVSIETWMKFAHPDDLKESGELLEKHFRGELDYYETDSRIKHKDGRWIWVLDRGKVTKWSDDGKPLLMMGTHQDISGRKLAEEQLQAAKQAAEAANITKSRFLANMSHEIRTPMNGIIGLGHLAMQTEMSPKMRDYLCKITYSAESLMGVLNDILDFSKIEAGMLTIENTNFSTAAVLERIAALQTITAENKGLEVLFSVDHTVPPCLIGDQLRLQQVLGNLLNNAIKFTEAGSVLLTVSTIHCDMNRRQAKLCFSINDTGIGIPPDQLDRLFLPFTQSDGSTTRKYGGTGLGLSICQSLVELMGGTLTASSMPDKGSTFSFTLSFGIGDVFEHPECIPDNSGFSSLRTLVADDNPTALQVMGEMLQWWELRVTPVSSGPGALAEIIKESKGNDPYRLLLLDWRMPELDGLELVRCLKAELAEGLMPTVFITTAFGNESLREEAASLGVRAFIAKPVFPADLHHAIRSALSGETIEITTAAREVVSGMPAEVLSGVRVLLAEDNPINTQLAVELLERVGVSVTTAANGQEAVDLVVAANGSYDLVLMDIQMPVMDGHEATILLRERWDKNQLPIVAMTAHAMKEERERCLASGMNDHLAKPINPDELFRVVATMAGKDIASILQPLTTAVDSVQLPENLPGLNIQDTLKRFMNDQRFMADTMSNFVAGSQDTAELIMDAAGRDSREELKRAVHTLKGLSGNVGAVEVNAACKQMESLLRDNSDAKRIIEQADTIRNLMDRAFESINIITTRINSSTPEKPVASEVTRDATLIFHELQQALKDMNFESIALTRELTAALPGSCETGVLSRQVEGLDFKGALITLTTLVDKVNADET